MNSDPRHRRTVLGPRPWPRRFARCVTLAFALGAIGGGAAQGGNARGGESPEAPVTDRAGWLLTGGFKLRHWSLEEGAPSRINAITQARDGFLWLGGVEGLVRFDGLSFTRIGPHPAAPDRIVVARLLTARDGTIWIGLARRRGMLVWRNGRLSDPAMPNPSREVNDIAEGPDGSIWVARGGRGIRSLARWQAGHWTEFTAASGLPERPVWSLRFTRDGTLWLTTEDAVYRRPPAGERFLATGIPAQPRAALAEAPDGSLWLSDRAATRIIARGSRLAGQEPALATRFAIRTLFDRQGDLWGVTWNDGAFRIARADGRGQPDGPDWLDIRNGLLANPVRAQFEDREGNLWIGGELGLNMVRRVPISAAAGVPMDAPTSYMLASDGRGLVYIANDRTLFAVRPGGTPRPVLVAATPIEAICQARAGGIWVIRRGAAGRFDRGLRSDELRLPADLAPNSCGEDGARRLWLPALQKGLFVGSRGAVVAAAAVDGPQQLPGNVAILPDGRAAIHFRGTVPRAGGLPFIGLNDGSVPSNGVEGLLTGAGTLFTSGGAGLAAPLVPDAPLLATARYAWAGSLNGLVQTAGGDTWAIGDQGLLRLRSAELAAALARPGRALSVRVFDFRDGLASFVQKSSGTQMVAGGDGRVWFATRGMVASIDPAAIRRNLQPPDAVVTGLNSDSDRPAATTAVTFPASVNRVEVVYTATSLATPDRVRFRTRLIGLQSDWVEVGGSRTAAFADLAPGHYRFEVLAANEDGVWSTRPAIAEFTIARAFHQTLWFRVAVAILVLGLLYLVYAWRLQQVSNRIRNRMLARTSERERIARELHDTMIQGVQGLILRFQSVADRFAHDPAAAAILSPALERAEDMLIEGRERVTGLRRSPSRDLPEELVKLMTSEIYPVQLIAPLIVQKVPRALASGLIEDLLAVLGEALNNAACHAQATRIEVGVRYGRWTFSAFVRDNGIGISEAVLRDGASGHFGLVGMQERMASIGGRLQVSSAEGFGTEVRVTLPARIAYRRKGKRGRR